VVRIGGALFACFAAVGWIAERLLGVHNSIDLIVNTVAQQAVWIAAALFLTSLICFSVRNRLDSSQRNTFRDLRPILR